MHSERRVLLSGGGVSGGDGLPVSSGADNLSLRGERKRVLLIVSANILTHQFLFPVGGKHFDHAQRRLS